VTAAQPAPPAVQAAKGPILEVRDLHVHFGARRGRGPTARAVDGVDLQIQPGEIVALAGESGCGKTSLARAILGLVEPTSGQVLYRGRPIGRGTSALKPYRREVQLVLQDPTGALNPRQSVYESVAEGLRIQASRATRRRWSPTPLPAAACARRAGSSSPTPMSCRAASASGW
jgi:ABC-type glutathione transport system ATPase component